MTSWDGILRGGRAIDPESGLDAILDVAVSRGRIAAIGRGLPSAPAEVDVAGLVVTAVSSTCTVTSTTWPACGFRCWTG
jgi:predicted amidohydrolase